MSRRVFRDVIVRLGGEMTPEARKALADFGSSLDDVVSNARRKLGTMFRYAGIAAAGFLVTSVKAAADAAEQESKFLAVFKDQAEDASKWAKTFAAEVNRDADSIRLYMSTLQDTFVPLGFAREEGTKLSQTVSKLTVDLASFNNRAEHMVLADLQSAIVGNHETMRKYGVIIQQTTLNQELLNMGVAGGVKAATEAQKVQARLNLILKGTTDAQGDAARTSGSFTNSLRGVRAAFHELQVTTGKFVTESPVVQRIIGRVTTLFRELTVWIEKNEEAIGTAVDEGFRELVDIAKAVGPPMIDIIKFVGSLVKDFPRLTVALGVLHATGMASLLADIAKVILKAPAAVSAIRSMRAASAGGIGGAGAGAAGGGALGTLGAGAAVAGAAVAGWHVGRWIDEKTGAGKAFNSWRYGVDYGPSDDEWAGTQARMQALNQQIAARKAREAGGGGGGGVNVNVTVDPEKAIGPAFREAEKKTQQALASANEDAKRGVREGRQRSRAREKARYGGMP